MGLDNKSLENLKLKREFLKDFYSKYNSKICGIENLWGTYEGNCSFLNKGQFNEKFFNKISARD